MPNNAHKLDDTQYMYDCIDRMLCHEAEKYVISILFDSPAMELNMDNMRYRIENGYSGVKDLYGNWTIDDIVDTANEMYATFIRYAKIVTNFTVEITKELGV